MNQFLSAPVTDAQRQRDALLGALVGLARSTVNEPKTEDTDRVLTSGLRLAADPDAAEDALRRMYHIVETEKHRVAPNCAICTMRCGNTDNYDLARLWAAPENIRALKLRLLAAVFRLAQGRPDARTQEVIDQALFVLAEDWDEELLAPVVKRAEDCCAGQIPRKFLLFPARCISFLSAAPHTNPDSFFFLGHSSPLLSEFSAPGAEIWGCFFQKTLYKRQRNNYYISIVLPIVGTNRKRSD